MKQMKMMIAMMAILMGITFTSCLDSDNDYTDYSYVTINKTFMDTVESLTTDDGLTLIPQNPSQMALTDGTIPKRACIGYELAEGEKYNSEQTKYNIVFKEYYDILFIPSFGFSDNPVESVSPLLAISSKFWTSLNGYLNVECAYYTYKEDSENDFRLFIDKIESNTIYFKLVLTTEVEKASTYSTKTLSFDLRGASIISDNPDLTPDKDGYYNAIIIADGINDETSKEIDLKSETCKIVLPEY